MATITYTKTVISPGPVLITWAAIGDGDTGAPVELLEFVDRAVQVEGSFAGGTCEIQGSIDGVNWRTLTDPQGNTLTITAGRIEQITELVRYLRPAVTGAGAAIEVHLLMRKP